MRVLALIAAAFTLTATVAVAQTTKNTATKEKTPPPTFISGTWTGTWSQHVPPGAAAAPQLKLDCTVAAPKDGQWQATIVAQSGGATPYTIPLVGRENGTGVIFKGTVNLGEANGGVYEWMGRASGEEFVGFYSCGAHAGPFRMTRRVRR